MSNNLADSNKKHFSEILSQIQLAKKQAFQQANTLLVELYWNIGRHISSQVEQAGWGKSVVRELAAFIKDNDPELKGFSDKNLWRMKQFYEIYKESPKLATLWRVLPWSHNRRIMSLKTSEEREFYLHLCKQKQYSFIADYETKLIPKELLRKKLNEFYALLEGKVG